MSNHNSPNSLAKKILSILAVLIPFIVFVIHASLFKNWIIDDAGISFAYAKNLINGFGLVPQPGTEPVEGFSNPLWVFLMTPFFFFKLFHPIITPKITSLILIFGSYLTIYNTTKYFSKSASLNTFVILTLLATNTSFVIWTTSGLENPLYIFLLTLFFLQLIKTFSRKQSTDPTKLSMLCFLLTATRPDGILFLAIYPIVLTWNHLHATSEAKTIWKPLTLFFASFLFMSILALASRYIYFHDFMPNTYYMKGGPGIQEVINLVLFQHSNIDYFAKASDLLNSILGQSGNLLFFIVIIFSFFTLGRNKQSTNALICFCLTCCSLSIYLLLPKDWMGEYRFASPFILFFYINIVILGAQFAENSKIKPVPKCLLIITIGLILCVPSVKQFYKRSIEFSHHPITPFNHIAIRELKYKLLAEYLDINNPSILIPESGAFCYYPYLTLIDLGGLVDKTIAKTLGAKSNPKDYKTFHNYILNDRKPTFVHMWKGWNQLAKLRGNARFEKEYIALQDKKVRLGGINDYNSIYVRRDAIKSKDLQKVIHAMYVIEDRIRTYFNKGFNDVDNAMRNLSIQEINPL